METAQPVTEQLKRQLSLHQLINPLNNIGTTTFYSSKYCLKQQALFSHILQRPLRLNMYP
ncbi:MAG: glutamate racemase [Cognaticolwellia sp.]|jgi:glutamate racemase